MAGEIKYRWTGQVMEPVDLIGLYGLDPLNPAGDTYIATGDSGQGACCRQTLLLCSLPPRTVDRLLLGVTMHAVNCGARRCLFAWVRAELQFHSL